MMSRRVQRELMEYRHQPMRTYRTCLDCRHSEIIPMSSVDRKNIYCNRYIPMHVAARGTCKLWEEREEEENV